MQKILTIGIPTYNRAHSLVNMLPQLVKDIGEQASKIEIIISDNCSTDNTQSIIEDWKTQVPSDLTVKIHKNSKNIGVSRNLVSLFYMTETPFFMFLGDDDRLNGDFFPELMRILQLVNPPTAVIQGIWNGKLRTTKEGFVNWSDSLNLFYEYGNAWAGVVKTKEAVRAIESRNLRSEIEQIVWPQTIMAFLAMYDSKPNQVYISNVELGSRLSANFNIYNKAYHNRSLYGLLFAAATMDDAIGGNRFKNAFLRISCIGFISHVKGILIQSLLEKGGEDTSPIKILLKRKYKQKGYFWSAVLELSDHYHILYFLSKIIYPLVKWKSTKSFNRKLDGLRIELATNIANKQNGQKRYGDWF